MLLGLLAALCVAFVEQDPAELGAPTDLYQAECTYCMKALHHTWVLNRSLSHSQRLKTPGSLPLPACPLTLWAALAHYFDLLLCVSVLLVYFCTIDLHGGRPSSSRFSLPRSFPLFLTLGIPVLIIAVHFQAKKNLARGSEHGAAVDALAKRVRSPRQCCFDGVLRTFSRDAQTDHFKVLSRL